MRPQMTAFLLSALVFPGLGQLYKQDRRKGVLLVLAANFLWPWWCSWPPSWSPEYTAVFYPGPSPGSWSTCCWRTPCTVPCSGCPAASCWPCGVMPPWTRLSGPRPAGLNPEPGFKVQGSRFKVESRCRYYLFQVFWKNWWRRRLARAEWGVRTAHPNYS